MPHTPSQAHPLRRVAYPHIRRTRPSLQRPVGARANFVVFGDARRPGPLFSMMLTRPAPNPDTAADLENARLEQRKNRAHSRRSPAPSTRIIRAEIRAHTPAEQDHPMPQILQRGREPIQHAQPPASVRLARRPVSSMRRARPHRSASLLTSGPRSRAFAHAHLPDGTSELIPRRGRGPGVSVETHSRAGATIPSGKPQHPRNRIGGTRPLGMFFRQLLTPGCGDLVEPRPPVVVRGRPLRPDPAGFIHPVQRGVQRSLPYLQALVSSPKAARFAPRIA